MGCYCGTIKISSEKIAKNEVINKKTVSYNKLFHLKQLRSSEDRRLIFSIKDSRAPLLDLHSNILYKRRTDLNQVNIY